MFSVIMPVYNNEKTLEAAVRSVLDQTVSDLELIIVDDGSTDCSYETSLAFAAQDARVRVFQNPHGGVSAARNRGLDEAHGEYVLFIDSDDSWELDLLESVGVLESRTYKIFGYQTDYFHADGTFVSSSGEFSAPEVRRFSLNDLSPDDLLQYNVAAPWNVVFDRKVIEEHGLRFHTQCVYLEDMAFNLEYLQYCTSVEVVCKNLYHYYVNVDKKQILKRKFKAPFENADTLFSSAEAFLSETGKSFREASCLCGTVLGAYCREALSWTYEKGRREANGYLRQLNRNHHFRHLLTVTDGKFALIVRVAIGLGLLSLEQKMLKKRYW